MELKPGLRMRSQVCTTDLIAVRPVDFESVRGAAAVSK